MNEHYLHMDEEPMEDPPRFKSPQEIIDEHKARIKRETEEFSDRHNAANALADRVVRNKINREMLHAAGCGCSACRGIFDAASDWTLAPKDPLEDCQKDELWSFATAKMAKRRVEHNVFRAKQKGVQVAGKKP